MDTVHLRFSVEYHMYASTCMMYSAVEQFIRSKYERKIYMAKNAPVKDTTAQEKKSHSKQATTKKEASSNDRISRSNKVTV